MQKDLINDLIEKPQRETAGSDTASRFDYQKNWAFCHMLKRHMAGADYLVAFEFHDDVVFLEPSDAPTKADFYQVKTSRSAKPKPLSALLSKGSKPNSILGKMCLNFEGVCSDHDTRVLLVSNIAFDFAADDICADDLDPKYRDKIINTLMQEVPSLAAEQLTKMHFIVTGVSIDAMQSFLQGEVSELFKGEFGEDHGLNIHSWIRLVQGEISRKNNFPSSGIQTSHDLVQKKCISRNFLSDSIACVFKQKTTPPDMQLINAELKEAGWDTNSLMRLGKQLPSATFDHSDATNREVARIVERLETILSQQECGNLPDFLNLTIQHASEISNGIGLYSDKHYLWALAILVYHEKV